MSNYIDVFGDTPTENAKDALLDYYRRMHVANTSSRRGVFERKKVVDAATQTTDSEWCRPVIIPTKKRSAREVFSLRACKPVLTNKSSNSNLTGNVFPENSSTPKSTNTRLLSLRPCLPSFIDEPKPTITSSTKRKLDFDRTLNLRTVSEKRVCARGKNHKLDSLINDNHSENLTKRPFFTDSELNDLISDDDSCLSKAEIAEFVEILNDIAGV